MWSGDLVEVLSFHWVLGITESAGWTLQIIASDTSTVTCLRQNMPNLSSLNTFHSNSQYLGLTQFE